MDMLCLAAEADPTGYVLVHGTTPTITDLARLTGAPEAEVEAALAELDRNGVFSRDRKGRIYSRRMVRDEKKSQEGRKNVKKRYAQIPENKEKNPGPTRGPTRDPSTKRPEARDQIREPSTDVDGAVAALPPSLTAVCWKSVLPWLVQAGTPEKSARSLLGKWLRDHEPVEVLTAMEAARLAGTQDVIPYMTKALTPSRPRTADEIRAVLERKDAGG